MGTTDAHKPRKRAGRPPALTTESRDRIISAVRAGNYLTTAAALANVSTSSVYRWLERAEEPGARREYREFRDALARARAEAEARVVATIMRGVTGGAVVKEVTRTLPNGAVETERQVAPPNPREGLEFLSRAFPDRWARRQALEVTGADGGPLRVEHTAGIAALAERLRASLDEMGPDGEPGALGEDPRESGSPLALPAASPDLGEGPD